MCEEKNDSIAEELGDSLIREAIAGDLPAVRQLVYSGADVNFANMNGVTPLMAASQWKRLNVIEFLLANGASSCPADYVTGWTALMYACLSGSPQCVEILVKGGAEVNVRDACGMTALMLAALTGKTEMVRRLVKAGAEVGARAESGLTAMDCAEKCGNRAVVETLLSTDGRIRTQGATMKRAEKGLASTGPKSKPEEVHI